jgi:hypothetical protein
VGKVVVFDDFGDAAAAFGVSFAAGLEFQDVGQAHGAVGASGQVLGGRFALVE